jgi:hypothetical protein
MHAPTLLRLFFESKPLAMASEHTPQLAGLRAWSSLGIEWLTPVPKKVRSKDTADMQ